MSTQLLLQSYQGGLNQPKDKGNMRKSIQPEVARDKWQYVERKFPGMGLIEQSYAPHRDWKRVQDKVYSQRNH